MIYQKTRAAALRAPKPINVFAPTLPQVPAFTNTPAVQPARPIGMAAPAVNVRTPVAPPKPAADPFDLALQLIQDGRLDEALVKLYEKLDRDAAFVPTYYTLGKIYANKGNLEEAQAWCEKAIQKDKLHAAPYYTLSLVYQEHGLVDQAIDALKRAVYLDRDFVLAHYTLAQLYHRHGDKLNAQRSLHNALRLLESLPRDQAVPEGDGMMVGRLRESIEHELAEHAR